MRKIKFTLMGVKPLSVNHARYRMNSRLNLQGRAYREAFFRELKNHETAIHQFNDKFDPDLNSIALNVTLGIPQEFFYTRRGYISRRSGDVDNYLKLIIDFLTNKRHREDQGIQNITIDDIFITDLFTRKIPTVQDWSITVEMFIIPLRGKY